MTRRPRDSQRSKVYRAENPVIDQYVIDKPMTLAQVRDYVKAIYQRERVRARFPRWRWGISVKVGSGRTRTSRAWARTMSSEIVFAPGHLHLPMLVLHEVAHCLSPVDARHGPVWVDNYLWLVRTVMGREAHDKLKAAFLAGGVKIKPKAKRTLTDEQRQALRDRMVALRQRQLQERAA